MGALAAMLLPGAAGLALVALRPWVERRFGAAAASALAGRVALTAIVLALLLVWQLVERGQLEHRFRWLHVGHTTAIDWLVQLDPLALMLTAAASLALVLGVIAGLAAGPEEAGRSHTRNALAVGGALVVAMAGSGWQLGLGLGAIALASRIDPAEHGFWDMSNWACRDRTRALGVVALGLGVAALAWLVSAGDLELATLARGALLEGRSALVRGQIGGPFGAAPPGVIAALGIGAAALAWALAWPQLLARPWREGPAAATVMTAVGLPAIGVLLLRTHLPLALAPTALAVLTTAAAGLAAWAGLRAARASTSGEALAAVAQVALSVAIATAAIGEPVAAAPLLITAGLGVAAMIAGLGSSRRIQAAIAVVAGCGLLWTLGAGVAALASDLSAWSWGINAVTPGLALVGIAGLTAGILNVLWDRTKKPCWKQAEAEPLLTAVGLALALAAALGGLWPLADTLWPLFGAGRALEGAFALGPRPDGVVFGTGVGAALVAVAAAIGAALAWCFGPRPAAPIDSRAPATLRGLLLLGERKLENLTLWPGDERVGVAPGQVDVRGPLLAAVAAALAIVGSVLCNPEVVVLGPTRIHPVDLGGLDAAMVGAHRQGTSTPPPASSPPPPPAREQDVGPAPLGERGEDELSGPAPDRAAQDGERGEDPPAPEATGDARSNDDSAQAAGDQAGRPGR